MNPHVFFVPHPPIIINAVGQGKEKLAKDTINGMDLIGQEIKALKPELIVFISPHGNTFKNGLSLLCERHVSGDLADFGFGNIHKEKNVDLKATRLLGDLLDEQDIVNVFLDKPLAKAYRCKMSLDHGVIVPMSFIDNHYDQYEIMLLTPGLTSLNEQYQIGVNLRKALQQLGKSSVIVASGDLSHCLTTDGPYDYHPSGPAFDEMIRKALESADPMALISIDEEMVKEASQCGLASFVMGMGALDGYQKTTTIHSHQGPFGVGYLTATMIGQGMEPSYLSHMANYEQEAYEYRIKDEDDYIKLARNAIGHYIETYEKLDYKTLDLSHEFIDRALKLAAGVFVSIHKQGQLRGCIGTISPVYDHLIDELIYNAISAASKDPRFSHIEQEELIELEIKVDVLGALEKISSEDQLDPKKYGVVVEKGYRRGLLLPNLNGIDTVSKQVAIAKEKAEIEPHESVTLYRFKVERHEK